MNPRWNFASDNTAGMCPEALEALCRANAGCCASYGGDLWTEKAANAFRELFETDADVYFTVTGTAANSLALASLCQAHHAVIAQEFAHVETDECGAPEFFSGGSKLLLCPGEAGRVDPLAVESLVRRRNDIHYPRPRVLSLSQATEFGTLYSRNTLEQLGGLARELGLLVHMDDARFFNAVAALDCRPADLSWRAGVQVLCISGAKCGLGIGEALLFFDRSLSGEFAYRCKQAGQLVSKMRFMSAPWLGLLQGDTWLRCARHANQMAATLREGLRGIPGVELAWEPEANGLFVRMDSPLREHLRAKGWQLYDFIGSGVLRIMCSWDTQPADIQALLSDLREVT